MHTRFDRVFQVSVILKGLDGALELLGGFLFIFISSGTIAQWGIDLTKHELSTNPHDFIANFIVHITSHVSTGSRLFSAIYLLVHGAVKLVVVIAVLMNKFWAYPVLVITILGFLIYQCIQLANHFSVGLTLLSIFDAFIIIMAILEWQKQIALRREIRDSEPDH